MLKQEQGTSTTVQACSDQSFSKSQHYVVTTRNISNPDLVKFSDQTNETNFEQKNPKVQHLAINSAREKIQRRIHTSLCRFHFALRRDSEDRLRERERERVIKYERE